MNPPLRPHVVLQDETTRVICAKDTSWSRRWLSGLKKWLWTM